DGTEAAMEAMIVARETEPSSVDAERLNQLLGRMVGDLGAIATGALVVLGDRLGLYREMRSGEKVSAAELARRTGTRDRYVREWLSAQAAAGYVSYDEAR